MSTIIKGKDMTDKERNIYNEWVENEEELSVKASKVQEKAAKIKKLLKGHDKYRKSFELIVFDEPRPTGRKWKVSIVWDGMNLFGVKDVMTIKGSIESDRFSSFSSITSRYTLITESTLDIFIKEFDAFLRKINE